MLQRLSFFSKSSFKSRSGVLASETTSFFTTEDVSCLSVTSSSTDRKGIIGLLVWNWSKNSLNIDAIYLKNGVYEPLTYVCGTWQGIKWFVIARAFTFGNECQHVITWRIFCHIWIPRAATGSSSTHLVLQKWKGKMSRDNKSASWNDKLDLDV